MEDNRKFWNWTAGLYERFTRGGRPARQAYDEMEQAVTAWLKPDMKVLELAAGPGMLSAALATACQSLMVTDFSEAMIRQAQKKKLPGNVQFAVEDATDLSFVDQSFDAVVIANALHIMPDPHRAVKQMKRVLKPSGVIIAPTFTRQSDHSRGKERLMEAIGFKTYSRWTHETYRQFLEQQGLIVAEEKVLLGHTFPISFYVLYVSALSENSEA